MVVCTVPVDDVVNTAISVLRTGEIGDGKIFISPVSRVIKSKNRRRGQRGFIIGGIKNMLNSGDIGFMIIAATYVFLMTPGLAFFYGGLAQKKKCAQYNDDVSSIYGTFVGIVGTLRIFAFIQR